MQDLFRRIVGGRPGPPPQPAETSGAAAGGARPIPGAPFTRQELPDLLGETGGLAAFVAGRSDTVSPEFGVLSLVEAGLWLTFMGDEPRAAAAFRAAADALRPQAHFGAAGALALARREALPAEAGAKVGLYRSLAGDRDGARQAWEQTVEQYGSLVDRGGSPVDLAEKAWAAWSERLDEIDRLGDAAAREPDAEPFDPAKQGRISVLLAFTLLRLGDAAGARLLLEVEDALRATAPNARLKRYYTEMVTMAGGLAGILRRIVASSPSGPAAKGGGARQLEAAVRAYIKPAHPEALAFALELQRAFPDLMPRLLPPEDLTEALSAWARKRLAGARH